MFEADLSDGRSIEERVRVLIEDKTGFMCLRAPEGPFKGYDLRLDLRSMAESAYFERRYEVKLDKAAERTGNVAIELQCRGKPSGIVASTSDYWAIVVGGWVHFVEAAALREEVFLGKYPPVAGGDDKAAVIVLLPLTRLKAISKSIVKLP